MCDSGVGVPVHFHINMLNNKSGFAHFFFFSCCISPVVFLEGDLYSAAPLDSDGSSLQFRRKAGSRTHVWMYDNWVSGG